MVNFIDFQQRKQSTAKMSTFSLFWMPYMIIMIGVFVDSFGHIGKVHATPQEGREKLVENACFWRVPKLKESAKNELKALLERHKGAVEVYRK